MKIMKIEDAHALIKEIYPLEPGHCYMGALDNKKEKSVGVYQLNRRSTNDPAIGGDDLASYATKPVSILVHWNQSPRETENAATELYWRLRAVRGLEVNGITIQFIRMLVGEPVEVGSDKNGIYERVIEAEIIYRR